MNTRKSLVPEAIKNLQGYQALTKNSEYLLTDSQDLIRRIEETKRKATSMLEDVDKIIAGAHKGDF